MSSIGDRNRAVAAGIEAADQTRILAAMMASPRWPGLTDDRQDALTNLAHRCAELLNPAPEIAE